MDFMALTEIELCFQEFFFWYSSHADSDHGVFFFFFFFQEFKLEGLREKHSLVIWNLTSILAFI
jgi:hypothetical protein